jgi:hypothetical protein
LGVEVDTSLTAASVVRVFEQLGEVYDMPEALQLDKSTEIRSTALTEWCEDWDIELWYILLGKHSQNAFIE